MPTRLLLAPVLSGILSISGAAHAVVLHYQTSLSGTAEDPANASPGTGNATLTVDTVARTFFLEVGFADLLGITTAAHIHGPTSAPNSGNAGAMTQVPSFVGFPSGVTSGSYAKLFDMTDTGTWNTSFVVDQGGNVAGAEAAFLASLASGKAYLNLHTSTFGGGEIRGFFTEANPVPLPAGIVLALSALTVLGGIGLRRSA